MGKPWTGRGSVVIRFTLVLVIGWYLSLCYAQDDNNQNPKNPAAVKAVSQLFYKKMADLGKIYAPDIKKHLGFCIKNVILHANMSSKGVIVIQDIGKRVCTAAEVKIYFTSLVDNKNKRKSSSYLKPNKNCNLTAWIDGCEPGWACRVVGEEKAVMNDTVNIPNRSENCQPCCAGFFCPKGITCMIHTSTKYPRGSLIILVVELTYGLMCCLVVKYFAHQGHIVHQQPREIHVVVECFYLATCNSKSATQNIHAYGILLIAILTTSLLIVYNCSDQVLTTREQRLAASRERAIKSAKETAQAREKWRAAKENAIQGAIGLQQSLSRAFSRRKSVKQESSKGPLGVPLPATAASSSKPKKKEGTNLTKMIQQIEEDPDSHHGFDIGSDKPKDNNSKKPKAKDLHTRSQIFKYAYGKLEQEKAMEEQRKDLTFSGVIKMGVENEFEIRKRPLLEVAFKDLTLTLKGKNKQLLRSITGKMFPGRIAAVMGPSGAGKTTFLSAVCGKVRGCNITGEVLINGKNESIHSYKRIIGYVPQDDIVHGDLTVEENLRFSARCRLRADLPKAEKVLVVERVIESLGLQAIRDSLVGTVEKRGISGGQRKRVNVGLEMVMEPSLLILDEPTSGLDSSSSLLLLKALRREALEGMFDDFILLAKGGLTVYHGSVKKIEEYFTGLGITVPERVTPPDHYIDILEGIVKPGSNITREQLPVRWMLHNGYPVPPDMLHLCDQISGSSPEDSTKSGSSHKPVLESSFLRDLCQDMKSAIMIWRDHLMHNFLNEQDLSKRTTPGVLRQYRYFLGRIGKQRLREAKLQMVDYLILLIAGAALGTLAKVSDETFGALALLSKIAALRSFTLDRLQYWRESASGMSSLAYFLSKDTIDFFNVLIKPLVYLSMFYFFNNPRSSFLDNYLVMACLVYCVNGVAYALAVCLEAGPAQLWSVILPVVLSLVASQDKESKVMFEVGKFTYTKWALEAFVISNARKYTGVWLITRCGSMMQSGYSLNDWARCLIYLVVCGVVSRCVAFFFMLIFQKK
ncbi:hypothetical protein Cgig2_004551 [Carnegiea gigantea]|uniref:ABC transporter domain-containing protein n=1 Tax=Carnegiea gigantea TaxID=171969 RepID=A0A9Q1K8R9_9CARY|nr:hypothetical protein Cgig2_004551 [Carnegiea gigantea]